LTGLVAFEDDDRWCGHGLHNPEQRPPGPALAPSRSGCTHLLAPVIH
jgi:hypothetical protein